MLDRLLDWFNSLDSLPWRFDSELYKVLSLEMISQQTTLPVILKRYPLWIKKFPDLKFLAESSLSTVLREWEGLGYYARAKNFHMTANHLYTHGYPHPTDRKAWLKLPGIGVYTMDAILSRVYNISVLSIDVNIKRIIMRFLNKKEWNDNLKKDFIVFLGKNFILNPGDCNQALIRLGQILCKKKETKCTICPLSHKCLSKNQEIVHNSIRKKIVAQEKYLLIICYRKKILLEVINDGNMYSIPNISKNDWYYYSENFFVKILNKKVHIYTKYRDNLFPILLSLDRNSTKKNIIENLYSSKKYLLVWKNIEEISLIPFFSTYRLVISEAIKEYNKMFFIN